MTGGDHGHHKPPPIDPARELYLIIHPTLLKIATAQAPGAPPLTAFQIFQAGVKMFDPTPSPSPAPSIPVAGGVS